MPNSHLKIVATPQGGQEADRPDAGTSQLAFPATLQRYENGRLAYHEDSIAVEAPLRLQVEGVLDTTLARTPGDDMNPRRRASVLPEHDTRKRRPGKCDLQLRGQTRVSSPSKPPVPCGGSFHRPARCGSGPSSCSISRRSFERRQNLFKSTGSTPRRPCFPLPAR